MGTIHTLGVSPGTINRNTLIHDVVANQYGGWGIYNDEGSSGILVKNNLVYNTKYNAYSIHYAPRILIVRNNVFALGKLEVINRTRGKSHTSIYFEIILFIPKARKIHIVEIGKILHIIIMKIHGVKYNL